MNFTFLLLVKISWLEQSRSENARTAVTTHAPQRGAHCGEAVLLGKICALRPPPNFTLTIYQFLGLVILRKKAVY